MKLEFQWAQVLDASKQMNGWCFRLLPFSLSRVIADKWHFIRCHKLQHSPWLTYPPSIDPSAILLPATVCYSYKRKHPASWCPFCERISAFRFRKKCASTADNCNSPIMIKAHALFVIKSRRRHIFSRQTHSRSKNFIQAKACSCDSRQLPSRITEVHRHFK